jgi:hypothetical protein
MAIVISISNRRCQCGRKLIDGECQQCLLYASMEPSGPQWDLDNWLTIEDEVEPE